jgi:hypothetical protein
VSGERPLDIPAEVAAAAGVPDDLDSVAFGPYAVPDTVRRRRSAVVYLVAAVATAGAAAAGLPAGLWVMAVGLLVIAGYHVAAGWRLRVREGTALETANRRLGFAAGHASARLSFTGWRARPVWDVLVFAAIDPPDRRALVRVDARRGDVLEYYEETIAPEP